MKIKQLLGMMALDANANEVGKIDDAEFDPEEGKINAITIVLKKNIISSNKIEIDFEDVKSIGDYVLLNKEINKEAAIEESKKAKEEVAEEEVEEVEAEIVDEEEEVVEEAEEEVEETADVKIE
ncbi:PRC-barrel domain-containing protein [Methanobrevibacter sp.]|jgi:sporulation protein YlmC with PRC-barrel domain|uniref:PRC-barrel domain-containing protein n=1 Tax=Methanobrevibacter sp. TaxID=66852 RepID=UPI00388FD1ED